MLIKQLGNGGGLASALEGHINSAFLIDLYNDHSEYLLFDCGYNIMKRLEEEEREDPYFTISKIQYVVISHKHADHCGNLETLIYWNHFKNNVQMDIYVACKGLAKTVKDTKKIEDNFKTIKANTYNSLTIVKPRNDVLSFTLNNPHYTRIYFIKALHGAKSSLSFAISNTSRYIFISGDTKANARFEDFVIRISDYDIIFHDYSNWNDESKNIHACKTDYEREYSQEFRDKAIKYHTGNLDFNKNWQ